MLHIEDPFLRQLLWSSFHFLVRDAIMKPSEFLELVRKNITFETEAKLVQTVLMRAGVCIQSFLPDDRYVEHSDLLFDVAYQQIPLVKEDFKLVWLNSICSFAHSKEKITILVNDMVENKIDFPQTVRWSIVIKAFAYDLEGRDALLERELEKDKSDDGNRSSLTAKASIPTTTSKAETWRLIHDKDNGLSLHQVGSVMSGFVWQHQKELIEPYIPLYFENIREIYKTRQREFAQSYLGNLFPDYAEDPRILTYTENLLKSLQEDETILIRGVKEHIDDLKRSIKCYERELS